MTVITLVANDDWGITPLAFIVVSNLVLTGVILTTLGLMSLYLSKIYSEVQNRPLYSVRRTLNLKESHILPGSE